MHGKAFVSVGVHVTDWEADVCWLFCWVKVVEGMGTDTYFSISFTDDLLVFCEQFFSLITGS